MRRCYGKWARGNGGCSLRIDSPGVFLRLGLCRYGKLISLQSLLSRNPSMLLRSFAVSALALFLLCADLAYAAEDPKAEEAVQKIRKLNAAVNTTKYGDVISYSVSFYGSDATDADLKLLTALKPLRS